MSGLTLSPFLWSLVLECKPYVVKLSFRSFVDCNSKPIHLRKPIHSTHIVHNGCLQIWLHNEPVGSCLCNLSKCLVVNQLWQTKVCSFFAAFRLQALNAIVSLRVVGMIVQRGLWRWLVWSCELDYTTCLKQVHLTLLFHYRRLVTHRQVSEQGQTISALGHFKDDEEIGSGAMVRCKRAWESRAYVFVMGPCEPQISSLTQL